MILFLAIDWDGNRVEIGATDPAWPKWSPSEPTSPHWYRPDHLERLIAAYISHDQDHDQEHTVRAFVSEFRGLTGSAKQKKVLDRTGLSREPLSALLDGDGLDHEKVAGLLEAMKANSKSVKPTHLGIIGRDHLEARFRAAGCEMESFQYKKVVDTTDGVPWIVETAFGWCPKGKSRRLITGVNWSPGIVNPFRELGSYGESLDTILSQQRADRDEPVILVLHMACPRVEYTDRGKSAVVVSS